MTFDSNPLIPTRDTETVNALVDFIVDSVDYDEDTDSYNVVFVSPFEGEDDRFTLRGLPPELGNKFKSGEDHEVELSITYYT